MAGTRAVQVATGGHDVVKDDAGRGFLAQHLEGQHRRATVREVVHEHEGFGGIGCAGTGEHGRHGGGGLVQVIAQRIGLAAEHEGMFLVRVIARQRGIVLRVDGSHGLQAVQGAAAIIAGEDDLTRVARPLE